MSGHVYEVAIVGAGPIGLELAVALKKEGIDYIQFDAQQVGHTVSWFAPGTHFFSSNERLAIAGVPLHTIDQGKATREEYLQYLRTVIGMFELKINAYEKVTGIERSAGRFLLTTRSNRGEGRYEARRVVLATGGTASPRMLNVPGEDLPHVSHYLEDPHRYFQRRLHIVGGRNSAVEAALRCFHAGAEVSLSYRRGEFDKQSIKYWLSPGITGLISAGRIQAHFDTVVRQITPTHVRLMSTIDPTRVVEVAADMVLLLVGYVADMSLCRLAGVTLVGPGEQPVVDENTMETNVPGLYLAGTVVGGTQERYRLFIENCHVHVERIVAAIRGRAPRRSEPPPGPPES